MTDNDNVTYDEHQFACPECGSKYIEHEHDKLFDGGGNYQCDCLMGYCMNCKVEWIEPTPSPD